MVEAPSPRRYTGRVSGWTSFFIGDSISVRYGPWLEDYLAPDVSYARKSGLNDALKDLDVPQGANGGDSAMVLEYLLRNEYHHEIKAVDLLVVNCGLHDIKTDLNSGTRQVGPEDYRSNLERIVHVAETLCRWFVWISTTPCVDAIHNSRNSTFHRFRDDVVQYNQIADSVMKSNGVPVIDLFRLTVALEAHLGDTVYEDHVHFIPEVRRLQAAHIAGWVDAHCQAHGAYRSR